MKLISPLLFSLALMPQLSTCGGTHTIPSTALPCQCDTLGHGTQVCDDEGCGPCMCLALDPKSDDPSPNYTFYVDADFAGGGDGSSRAPWKYIDWPQVDEALEGGDVLILFSALEARGISSQEWDVPLEISRSNMGPNRVVIDGGAVYNADDLDPRWFQVRAHSHAIVPGISTGFEDIPRHRITLRGFEVTGSEDKGVYWRAGDGIILEDLVVHDNRGTPAINLEYANRTGLPSASFTLRNSHVYNQFAGECVYIGGSEGEDQDAHAFVEVSNNLIHHCWDPVNIKHDGINIKDRVGEVVVTKNVVFTTNWGLEIASPGLIEGNLVFDTYGNGFHLNDYWGSGLGGMILNDNTVLRAGEHGIRLDAENQEALGVVATQTRIIGSRDAGLLLGGVSGLEVSINGLILANNSVGIDGWGDVDLTMEGCIVDGNGDNDGGDLSGAASECQEEAIAFGDLSNPAGADGVFFTGDEGYLGVDVSAPREN